MDRETVGENEGRMNVREGGGVGREGILVYGVTVVYFIRSFTPTML